MENLLEVAQQVAVLFVMMGVGAALRRLRMLDDAAVGGMVNLLMFVVTPCVVVDCFQRPFDRLNHESGLFGPVTRRMQ